MPANAHPWGGRASLPCSNRPPEGRRLGVRPGHGPARRASPPARPPVAPGNAQPPDKKPNLTTDTGRPVGTDEHSMTAGPEGPTLLEHFYLLEKLARFDRERIPERVVHARGVGVHGRVRRHRTTSRPDQGGLPRPRRARRRPSSSGSRPSSCPRGRPTRPATSGGSPSSSTPTRGTMTSSATTSRSSSSATRSSSPTWSTR